MKQAVAILLALSIWISAYYHPNETACAFRAANPFVHYPVWCQAKEWPKP